VLDEVGDLPIEGWVTPGVGSAELRAFVAIKGSGRCRIRRVNGML
jgi:hypothetical protein